MAGGVHPACHNSGGPHHTDFDHDVCNHRWPREAAKNRAGSVEAIRHLRLAALPSKLHLGKDGRLTVELFGNALGFIVNYSPDQAVRYDLKGNAVETLSKALRLGKASFSLKGGKQVDEIGRGLDFIETFAS